MLRALASSIAGSLLILGAHVRAQDTDQAAQSAGERIVTGERVCLPQIPDENGRVSLDCAIGLRGDDDHYYGLRAADPSKREPFPVMNERVLVRGRLVPGGDGRYEIAGHILYTSIEPLDEPKVVTGTLLCIEDQPVARSSTRCRSAIQTAGGRFWGLEASSFDEIANALALTPGMQIKVEGTILSPWPEDWRPWAYRWSPRQVEGVLEVKGAEAVR